MHRLSLVIFTALIALVLPSCLQSETTIHLQKDGSGTLVEQTSLGEKIIGMFEQMAALTGAPADDPLAGLLSEKNAKEKAAALGEGVTFESAVPVAADGKRGVRTTFRFADINKLKISPGSAINELSSLNPQAPAAPRTEPLSFSYTDGSLTINLPEPEKPDAPAADLDAEAMDPQQVGAMREMVGDMTISFKIVFESGIDETDATHRDGNTVTLVEMQMAKILDQPDSFKKLASVPQNDPGALMQAFKNIDGMKMEHQRKVTVKVK
jgi:hypothetical protein